MRYGLHIKTAGDLPGTPARAHAMGAGCFQFFAGSPRTFSQPTYTDDVADRFKESCTQLSMPAYIHMMYLTAYGTPDSTLRAKSVAAAKQTMVIAEALGVRGVVTHMGSHKGEGLENVLGVLTVALSEVLEPVKNSKLLLEISAGSGGNIGGSIQELAVIYTALSKDSRIGFCLDTAHMFAGGYAINTFDGWDSALGQFDELIGIENLSLLHLNDSKTEFDSKRDRHENIGDGYIGNDGFKVILGHPLTQGINGILEVPGIDGKGPDAENLQRLQELSL